MRGNSKLAKVGAPDAGTLPYLLEAMLFRKTDVAWRHVVYAGGPPAISDLIGGQITALILPEGLLSRAGPSEALSGYRGTPPYGA